MIISSDFNELGVIIIQFSQLSWAGHVIGFVTKELTFNTAEG
jgi:hypothetical protein